MDDLIAKPLEPRVLKQALVAYLGSDTDERLAG